MPAFPRLANAVLELRRRHGRWLVVAMLGLLHGVALGGVGEPSARALLLAHAGLLLLWQPILPWRGAVSALQAAFIALAAAGIVLWLNGWLLALWVIVLAALVGGRVFQDSARWQRRFYFGVLVYLVGLLAIVILPQLAPLRETGPGVALLARSGLPLLLAALLAFPVEAEEPENAQLVDFFYSVVMALALVVLVLGSFTFMTVGRTSYLGALAYSALLIGALVLLIGLAWSPRMGYAGLDMFFSRHLFSIGQPLERWLKLLAELAQAESRPERFLARAAQALARLPWVAGAAWRAAPGRGEAGEPSRHALAYASAELDLTIYSRYRSSPALNWHLRLLAQLLADAYAAKLREQELRQASYLQAVHETGARLTHDVKNLLQSLEALCAAVERGGERGPEDLLALVRRQLPAIAQRVATTLERLRHPQVEAGGAVTAATWFDGLQRQYAGEGVEFALSGAAADARLPRALFDSVTDNLIRNALAKRAADAALRVRVALSCGDIVVLQVCDSGSAVPDEIARDLLRGPLPSRRGLGIGLHQAARQAQSEGYTLSLARNRDGDVCFALRGKPAT